MKHAATHKTLFLRRTLPAWVALALLPAWPLQAATQKDLPPKAKPVAAKPEPFVFQNPFAPKPPVTKTAAKPAAKTVVKTPVKTVAKAPV